MPTTRSGRVEHRGDLGHRQRGGVRGENRVVAHDRLERDEELVLDGEILERGFDHDVAVRQIGQLGRHLQTRDRRVARFLLECSLLDLPRQEVCDLNARRFATVGVDLTPDRVEARLDRELRDPGAHRAEADDADLHRRSTTPAIAMPKPTHIDAIP